MKSKLVEKIRLEYMVFFTSLIFISFFIKPYVGSPNDSSRMATIESLVEKHTFMIDNSTFEWTIDKVWIGNHWYSSKPPVLSVLSSVVYWILYNIFGVSFRSNLHLCYYTITLTVVGVMYSLLLVFFFKSLYFIDLNNKTRVILTSLLGFGTWILPWGTTFNSHLVAATLLYIGFYLLMKVRLTGDHTNRNVFVVGFLAALTATIEVPFGLICSTLFFIYLLSKKELRKTALFYIGGCIIPLIFHSTLNIPLTGNVIPAAGHPEFYNYSHSMFNLKNLSGSVSHKSLFELLTYMFHALFGDRGLFSYTPLLCFPVAMLLEIMLNHKHKFWSEGLMITLTLTSVISYYTLRTSNYGGNSYGFRWFVPIVPLLFFFIAFMFERKRDFMTPWKYRIFIVVTIMSVFVAFVGVYNPWTKMGLGPNSLLNNLYYIRRYGVMSVYGNFIKPTPFYPLIKPNASSFINYYRMLFGRDYDKILVDSIDVGDPSSEVKHNYRIVNETDNDSRSLRDVDGNLVEDDYRVFNKYESFIVQAVPGRDLVITKRVACPQGYISYVHLDGVFLGLWGDDCRRKGDYWTDASIMVSSELIKDNSVVSLTFASYENKPVDSYYYRIYVLKLK